MSVNSLLNVTTWQWSWLDSNSRPVSLTSPRSYHYTTEPHQNKDVFKLLLPSEFKAVIEQAAGISQKQITASHLRLVDGLLMWHATDDELQKKTEKVRSFRVTHQFTSKSIKCQSIKSTTLCWSLKRNLKRSTFVDAGRWLDFCR